MGVACVWSLSVGASRGDISSILAGTEAGQGNPPKICSVSTSQEVAHRPVPKASEDDVLVIAMTLLAAPVHAGPGDGRVGTTVQRADNRADQQDDRRDAAAIVDLVSQWNSAIAAGKPAVALDADRRIFAWLDREIAESKRDSAEANREAAGSTRELRGSRRQTAARGGTVNRLETGDDRRDRRDDRVDAAQARKDLEQTIAIDGKLRAMQPSFQSGKATPAQVKEKKGLLDQLVVMARRELAEGQEEMREDRGEAREDRRTRRR